LIPAILLQVAALPPPTDEALRLDIGIRFDIDLSHFDGGRLADQGLEFDDGFTLRRGRVDARPHWGERFSGRGHWDVADGNVELKDGWLQYEWVPDGRVRLGLFREPMGLEALTSSRYVTFVERSAPTNAFTPGRNTGALVADTFGGGRCTWALGAFAIHTLLGTDQAISRLRGHVYAFRGAKLVPTFHPAFLLRSPERKRDVWEDMKTVRALLESR